MTKDLSKEPEQPRQKARADKSPKPQKKAVAKGPVRVRNPRKPKASDVGDSTPRVSAHPQPGQPGPAADDVGKTTDTRAPASKKPHLKEKDWPSPVTTAELVQQPTAHDIAQEQPLRQSALPTPTEQVKVEGQPVVVIAEPHLVDPVELMPHRADTVIKDRARTEGLAIGADAPVARQIGGDILERKPGETRFKEQENGDLHIEGGLDG